MDDPAQDDALVPICKVGGYIDAEMLHQALEAEGIESLVEGANFSALFGLGPAMPWAIRILVRRRDKADALDILQELAAGREHQIVLLTD